MNTTKSFQCFLIIFMILSMFSCDRVDPNYSYDDFMKQFNRTYEGDERYQHEQIFNKNYADLIQKNKNGADLNINNFLDWNTTQLQEFLNYRPEKLGRPLTKVPLRSSLYLSPTTFDWRTRGRVTPIKDQLNCGGCWAFASTAQYQSLLAIQTNGTIFDLSQQYAIQCQKVSSHGCNGGYPPAALDLYNSTGIPLQTSYPYQPNQANYYSVRGKAICTDKNRIKLKAQTLVIKHFSDLTTQQIQQQLIDSGPLTVAVTANNLQFLNVGSSGLINNCPTDASPDHAVLLVGYNTTHWFIKNSWGVNWGDKGYCYISKTNDCKLSTWVDVMQIKTSATPISNPNITGYIEYNITMTDSKGDGWNGNILAFRQDNVIVATFGSGFDDGKSYGPQSVRIKNNVQTQIIVVQKGNYTNQIGFTIRNLQDGAILSRAPGTAFQATTIFKNFCPTSSCPAPSTVDYTISLTDAYGDGWNGAVLAFRQNGTIQKFGQNFTYGAQYPNTIYTFKKYQSVDIIVSSPGSWTQQIGFIIRNQLGYIVLQRYSGTPIAANSIVGTFCPECVNLSPVRVVGNVQNRQQQQNKVKNTPNSESQLQVQDNIIISKQILRLQSIQEQNHKIIKNLLIATIVLGSLVFLLMACMGVMILRNYLWSKNDGLEAGESNSSDSKDTKDSDRQKEKQKEKDQDIRSRSSTVQNKAYLVNNLQTDSANAINRTAQGQIYDTTPISPMRQHGSGKKLGRNI